MYLSGFDVKIENEDFSLETLRYILHEVRIKTDTIFPIQKFCFIIREIKESGLWVGMTYSGMYLAPKCVALDTKFLNNNAVTLNEKIHMVLHEIAHDIYHNHLLEKAINFWERAIQGDIEEISLKSILGAWPKKLKDTSLWEVSDYWKIKNPELSIKLKILLTWYRYYNLYSTENKKEFVDYMKDVKNYILKKAKEDPDWLKIYNTYDGVKYIQNDFYFRVPHSPITVYASESEEESFCEAFSMYAAYGPRSVLPYIQFLLKTILPYKPK